MKENGFGAILLLTGADVTNRSDAQMLYAVFSIPDDPNFQIQKPRSSPSYVLVPQNAPSLENSPIQATSRLPPYRYEPSVGSLEGSEALLPKPAIPIVPGGGLTRRLLSAFSSGLEKPVPVAAIVQFVVEGDNRGDAEYFAKTAAQIVGLQVGQWTQPPSWRTGLFGTPHDQSLYG